MRHCIPLVVMLAVGCAVAVPPSPPVEPTTIESLDSLPATNAQQRGIAYLLKHQSLDGAWRPDTYATFKDGSAITPFVTLALRFDETTSLALTIPKASSEADIIGCSISFSPMDQYRDARLRALQWLAAKVTPTGEIEPGPDGFPYPVYTAALSVIALSQPEAGTYLRERDAWLKYLLARQLNAENGWTEADKQYGGWGYYPRLPVKPTPGQTVPAQHLLESNLSATVFALEALSAAGNADPRVLGPARRFVESCQNADGGFHFIYDDPVRNKAGLATPAADGTPRFHSYGSTTADGVRALLLAGATIDDPKVVAGRQWLETHFDPEHHPGTYIATHERNRDAVYFYYTASIAKTFRKLQVTTINNQPWAERLANALMAKQKADGSWANPIELVRENESVLATAYAVQALAQCR